LGNVLGVSKRDGLDSTGSGIFETTNQIDPGVDGEYPLFGL
jgi:hypothetical protein